MFRKKIIWAVTCLLMPIILSAETAQSISSRNIYHTLYEIFARELDQKLKENEPHTNEVMTGQKTSSITSQKTKSVEQLCCIYCEASARNNKQSIQPQINLDVLEKISIIPTSNSNAAYTVLHKLSLPNETVFGTVARAELFIQPLSYAQLQENQQITRYFVEHPEVRKEALEAIKEIRNTQHDLLTLFSIDKKENDPLANFYWNLGGLKALNNSTTGLFVGDLYEQIFKTLRGITPPCAYIGARSGFLLGIQQILQPKNSQERADLGQILLNVASIPLTVAKKFGYGFWGEIVGHSPWPYAYHVTSTDKAITLTNKPEYEYTSLADRQAYLQAQVCPDPADDWTSAINSRAIERAVVPFNTFDEKKEHIVKPGTETFRKAPWRGPTASWVLAIYGLTLYDLINGVNAHNTYKKIVKDVNALRYAQKRLRQIARLKENLSKLYRIAKDSKIRPLQELAQELKDLIQQRKTDKNFGQLCNLLTTKTFIGEPSAFSNRARILLANRLLKKCKKLFLPALQSEGRIEIFVGAAEFYAQHQLDESVEKLGKPVCFVEFVDEEQPRLELENAWNVLLEEKKAVCVDEILFGKNGYQHAIFSGPNGTGKSTNENAIAHSTFMARLGIACASRATMTPFEVFEAHRNEQEDLSKGMSTFMAQKARFDDICKRIAHLDGQRMIIFMDEPLSGTVEAEAGHIIYDNCKRLLAEQKQAICIIATHAEEPTKLEADTDGAFKNFHVEVIETEPGIFKRTYRLRPGILKKWFDDPEWRHRFVQWLSTENRTDIVKN